MNDIIITDFVTPHRTRMEEINERHRKEAQKIIIRYGIQVVVTVALTAVAIRIANKF